MLIKSRNFTPNKTELTYDQAGFGWALGSEKKFEGTGINRIRYGKNYSKMKGYCLTCSKFTDKKGTSGEHCSLPRNEECQL